ncbi:MAG: hypothetical protein FWE66_04620, partial [Oscillospiraceae bacterium]|nr:hypothetical protein [Oscillospiraceae bacterium]
NIDFERFQREIIEPLSHEKPFAYRPYDCATLEFADPVSVEPTDLSVIEGVYSLHPLFLPAYDIKVFLALDENEQRRRLRMRSAELFDRFVDEWIPMENRYFEHYRVAENCDFVFYAGLPGKYQFYSDGGTAVRGE